MDGELREETWIAVPPAALAVGAVFLILAGISLLFWSDILVNLVVVFLGVFSILLGLGFLAAGHFLGRGGVLSVFLFIAGIVTILVGVLAFLSRDLIFDLIIYIGAALAILAGLFLLFIGALLSVRGWVGRGFLGAGLLFLLAGLALALFPGPTVRFLLATGGALVAAAGCILLFLAIPRGGGTIIRP